MVLEGTTASSWSCCVARPNEAGEGELPVVCCWYGADAADMTSAILSSPSQRTVAVSCRPLWPRRCYFYRSPLPKRFACLLAATMLASQPEQQQAPAHVSNLTLQIIRRYLGFNVLHSSDSLALLLSLALSLSVLYYTVLLLSSVVQTKTPIESRSDQLKVRSGAAHLFASVVPFW